MILSVMTAGYTGCDKRVRTCDCGCRAPAFAIIVEEHRDSYKEMWLCLACTERITSRLNSLLKHKEIHKKMVKSNYKGD